MIELSKILYATCDHPAMAGVSLYDVAVWIFILVFLKPSPTSPRMSRLVLKRRDEGLIYSHIIDYLVNAANIFRKLSNKVFFCGAFGFAAQSDDSVASNNGSSYGAC